MKKIIIVLFCLAFSFSFLEEKNSEIAVIAYYTGNENDIKNFDTQKLTHIIYSFLRLNGNRLIIDNQKDDLTLRKLVDLKKTNPNLKILISLGGWGGCEFCSDIFSSEKNREAFSKSVLKILQIYSVDGIDLDWEYPAIEGHPGHVFKPEDKQNFTFLIESLRRNLGETYEISFAAGAHKEFLTNSIEWGKVMPLVNNVNLMTYDLVNGYSKTTGHHSALMKTNQQHLSAEYTVNYLDSIGVPLNKMVIGAAFYARVWDNVPPENNGLYQKGTFMAEVKYNQLESYLKDNGFVNYWDSIAQAPYAYNKADQTFATFDNLQSVRLKTEYVKQKNLKGIMFWELMHDEKEGLVTEISKTIKK